MHEPGDDVAVLQIVVVVRAEDVGGDDGGEVASMLRSVEVVEDIDHALGVGVAWEGGEGKGGFREAS